MLNEEMTDKPFREVIKIVGIDAAETLCKEFGGSSIYIPKNINILARNMKIKEDYKTMPIFALRKKYNLSETQIRNIVNIKQPTIDDFLKDR